MLISLMTGRAGGSAQLTSTVVGQLAESPDAVFAPKFQTVTCPTGL